MNECYLKPPNGHLLLVKLWFSSPGVFDSPVICGNGITEKKSSTKTWHCECAKHSFCSWSECTFKGEIPQACVLKRGLKFNLPEPSPEWRCKTASQWHNCEKLKSCPGTPVPLSSLKLTSCLLMLVRRVPIKILCYFSFFLYIDLEHKLCLDHTN